MRIKKNQKGITQITLIITIIILLIIAGIGIHTGTDSLNKVKLEELKTNMLLIQAKAREYVEEANFKIGKETEEAKIEEIKREIYETKGKLKKVSNENLKIDTEKIPINNCYIITKETLENWGLDNIKIDENKEEKYLIEFKEKEIKVEIYNTKGYEGKYSLTELEK